MNVYNFQGPDNDNSLPFFHVSQGFADTAQIQIVKEGHFALAFLEGGAGKLRNDLHDLLPFVVDPTIVFGMDTTLSDPTPFFNTPIDDLLAENQGTTSRTPCALAGASVVIPPGASVTITSVYGKADSLDTLITVYKDKIRKRGFVEGKRASAQAVVKAITGRVSTYTSSALFDMYAEQSFLDNVLRGGIPLTLGDPANPKIFHVYSRIHGDLERDYNNFQVNVPRISIHALKRLDRCHSLLSRARQFP